MSEFAITSPSDVRGIIKSLKTQTEEGQLVTLLYYLRKNANYISPECANLIHEQIKKLQILIKTCPDN